jgi:hypothetical protein
MRSSLMICTPHPISFNLIEQNEMGRACSTYAGLWWGNMRERDHLGDPGIDGRIILRWIFTKWDVGVWTGSNWPG